MRTILALALVFLALTPCFAVQQRKPSLATLKKIESIKNNKNSWASILINLAELNATAGGPVEDLLDAIVKVIEDLSNRLDEKYHEYDLATSEHNHTVKELTGLISETQTSISSAESYLRDVLYVLKQSLEQDLVQLNTNIENARHDIETLTAERELSHSNYLTRLEEANSAIEAVDECLELLKTLAVGEFPSLIQMKKFQSSLNKVQQKVQQGKSIDRTLVKALVALASSQFTNQDALKSVGALLVNVKANFEQGMIKDTQDEEEAQASFVVLVNELAGNITRWTIQIAEKTEELEHTNKTIEDTLSQIEVWKFDLAEFEQALVDENAQFVEITRIFEDLVAQFQKELAACQEAQDILNSAEFAGYISERVAQDSEHVIGTAHGDQFKVNDWSV